MTSSLARESHDDDTRGEESQRESERSKMDQEDTRTRRSGRARAGTMGYAMINGVKRPYALHRNRTPLRSLTTLADHRAARPKGSPADIQRSPKRGYTCQGRSPVAHHGADPSRRNATEAYIGNRADQIIRNLP